MVEGSKKTGKRVRIQDYLPLLVIVVVAFLGGLSIELQMFPYSFKMALMNFMGLFFIQLSIFKLFDLKGFSEGFARYDLVTQRFKPYAYLYPFIELFLGLFFLTQIIPYITAILTIVIMAVSALGVFQAISKHKGVSCACLGTVIKVPLTTVSLIENVGMGVMALFMLF